MAGFVTVIFLGPRLVGYRPADFNRGPFSLSARKEEEGP